MTKTNETSSKTIDTWYQGELNLGYASCGSCKGDFGSYDTNLSRIFISTVHGVHITKYAFVGAGVGIQLAPGDCKEFNPFFPADDYYEDESWTTVLIPIFLNMKAYYPVSDKFAPYISLSFGGSFVPYSDYNFSDSDFDQDYKISGGYYGEYAVGLNYKRFNFSFGLQQQKIKAKYEDDGDSGENKYSFNSLFFKIGLMF